MGPMFKKWILAQYRNELIIIDYLAAICKRGCRRLQRKRICRMFSGCTKVLRNGMVTLAKIGQICLGTTRNTGLRKMEERND
jgi:hypothetical protein